MLIRAGYEIQFMADAPTPLIALLSVRPELQDRLRTPHRILVEPHIPTDTYLDSFGNVCTRLTVPTSGVTLSCDFVIEDSGLVESQAAGAEQHAPDRLPPEVVQFLLGSRYCDTDRLSDIAWSLFGHIAPGRDRVLAIVDYVHAHLDYGYQHARPTRTAWEGHDEKAGVCRDFAHLAIALCRCMNIPARYCSGYLGDIGVPPMDVAMDFHAWFEVFLGGAWHSFDARHRVPRIGRILMACGRDAADTALTTAFGPARLTSFKVHTDEVDADSLRREPVRLAA
jgi:transglutaminase-like putative cysteine protease